MKISNFCGYRHEALGPPQPPFVSNFVGKKLTPIFLEIESMIAKTNFTLGPIEKSIFLHSYNGLLFPLIDYSKGRGDHQGSHKVSLSKLSC